MIRVVEHGPSTVDALGSMILAASLCTLWEGET